MTETETSATCKLLQMSRCMKLEVKKNVEIIIVILVKKLHVSRSRSKKTIHLGTE